MEKEYKVDPEMLDINVLKEIVIDDPELKPYVDYLILKFSTIGSVDEEDGRRGKVKQESKAFLVFGKPESDCEAVAKSMSRENYARYLSLDEIKDAHPETKEDPQEAELFHLPAKYIREAVLENSLKNKDNIVFATRGNSVTEMQDRIKQFQEYGYEVEATFCDTEE